MTTSNDNIDQKTMLQQTPVGSKSPTVRIPIASGSEVPRIDVLKDGEIVRAIRISCSCGCSVDIKCEYSD